MVTIRPKILFCLFLLLLALLSECHSKVHENTAPGTASLSSYDSLKAQILEMRQDIYNQYIHADSAGRASLVESARKYLLATITNDVFAHWYNTPWKFSGCTTKPQRGTIACGYFVTTVIKDAGFDIPRIAWAQLASENMILKLNPAVKRFRNKSIDDFQAYFNNKPDGLYIVGLDRHVGFVSKINGELLFTHSSYYRPQTGVLSEKLKGWNPLNDSKYRVLGEILQHEMIVNWIMNKKYE